LVWQCIYAGQLLSAVDIWTDLQVLQYKTGNLVITILPPSLIFPGAAHLYWDIRTRLSPLWSRSELCDIYRRTLYSRFRVCWYLRRRSDDHVSRCSSSQTTNLRWTFRGNLWYCFCRWPTHGWCVHRQGNLEMVLLYQSTHRRHQCSHHIPRPQSSSTNECKPYTTPATSPARSARHYLLSPRHQLSDPSSSVGRNDLRMVIVADHPSPHFLLCSHRRLRSYSSN
jgi:hypothetical protein